MSSGRIEMPLEEFNAMKSKIDEFEKVLNSMSKEASIYKEESEKAKDLLVDIYSMTLMDRLTGWKQVKEKLEKFLKVK